MPTLFSSTSQLLAAWQLLASVAANIRPRSNNELSLAIRCHDSFKHDRLKKHGFVKTCEGCIQLARFGDLAV